jgi:hypothetical protein
MKIERGKVVRGLVTVVLLAAAAPFAYKYLVQPPPPRPATVPADAEPLRADTEPDQRFSDEWWWWLSCKERPDRAHECRLFDGKSTMVVAGTFLAVPRDWEDDAVHHAGACPGSWARYSPRRYYYGLIYLAPGCVLLPREWLYYPSRRTKAAVTIESAVPSLGREVAMSDEDLKAIGH